MQQHKHIIQKKEDKTWYGGSNIFILITALIIIAIGTSIASGIHFL